MKYTPGPWETFEMVTGAWALNSAVLNVGTYEPGGAAAAESNARLIAAAPELLEACKEAMPLIKIGNTMQAYFILSCAIKKAEGKE